MVDYKKSLGDLLYNLGCKIITNDSSLSASSNNVQGRLIKRLGNSIQSDEYSYNDFLEFADDILTEEAKSYSFETMLIVLTSPHWMDLINTTD